MDANTRDNDILSLLCTELIKTIKILRAKRTRAHICRSGKTILKHLSSLVIKE